MRLVARTLALILAARRPEKPAPAVSSAVMPVPVVGEASAIKHRDLYAADFEVIDESTISPHLQTAKIVPATPAR